ncbi:hypothetical protein BC828DRAFT_390781 [Blastocladiella britannica]|nr:hypothetical protein BC828DRAFT_390781 [Blastocladiella britannica]
MSPGSRPCNDSSTCFWEATCQLGSCVLNKCRGLDYGVSCGYYNETTYCSNERCIPRDVPMGGPCSIAEWLSSGNNPCVPPLVCDAGQGKCNYRIERPDYVYYRPSYDTWWVKALFIAVCLLCVLAAYNSVKSRREAKLKRQSDAALPTHTTESLPSLPQNPRVEAPVPSITVEAP